MKKILILLAIIAALVISWYGSCCKVKQLKKQIEMTQVEEPLFDCE